MFDIGLQVRTVRRRSLGADEQLLHDDPHLAKSIKMNDLGKQAGKRKKSHTDKRTQHPRLDADPDSEPWKARVTTRDPNQTAKQLAVLSDDE